MTDNKEMIDKLKSIVNEAGLEIMKIYKRGFSIKYKHNNSPVTDADIASNQIIEKELSTFGFPILSEETADDKSRLLAQKVWIVDPLDGTKDFIEKTGEFCIMIALVEKNEPVFGVIYVPVKDIFYHAQKGKGAFMRIGTGADIKLNASSIDDPKRATMLLSRHHLQPAEVAVSEKLGIKKCIPSGSAGVKAGLIADGKAELYVVSTDTTMEWDACAADIIISESGGKMTDITGKKLIYNKKEPANPLGFIVSNGPIHSAVVRELKI